MHDARDAAAGHEAVIVSHQLPIWTTRLHVEDRSFLHDPRKPPVHAVQPDVARSSTATGSSTLRLLRARR